MQLKSQMSNATNANTKNSYKKQDKIKQDVNLKSSAILRLESHIVQAKKNQQFNNYILWLCVALFGLFMGIALKK